MNSEERGCGIADAFTKLNNDSPCRIAKNKIINLIIPKNNVIHFKYFIKLIKINFLEFYI